MKEKGAIPDIAELLVDLTVPNYDYKNGDGKFEVESSKSIKTRGCKSIDLFCALALTHAFPVQPKERWSKQSRAVMEHDPFASSHAETNYDMFGG